MKKAFIILFLIIIAPTTEGNFWKKVSIFRNDKQEIKDLERATCGFIENKNFEQAFQYARKGLRLSIKIKSQENIANFYYYMGWSYRYLSNFDSARICIDKSINMAKQLKKKEYIARGYLGMADILFRKQGKFDEAAQLFEQGVAIYVEVGNKAEIAKAYLSMSNVFMASGNYDKAMASASKSTELVNKLNDKKITLGYHITLADIYCCRAQYDSAFYQIGLAQKFMDNTDEFHQYRINILLGDIYLSYSNYSKAVECLLKALSICEKIKYDYGRVVSYNYLGLAFKLRKDYKTSISYSEKCLSVSQKKGLILGVCDSYLQMGYDYYQLNEYTKAEHYFLETLALAEKLKNQHRIAQTYNYLGLNYISQKSYDKAMESFRKGLDVYTNIDDQFGMAEVHSSMGNYYQSISNYNEAIRYFKKSLTYHEKSKGNERTQEILLSLSENYSRLSQFQNAYECFKRYKEMSDSTNNYMHGKQIAQLEMQYEFDKKQKDQEFFQQQKEKVYKSEIKSQRIIALLVMSFLLSLIFLVFRNYILKQKNIRIEAEKKLELDQMKLHFFANASHDIRTPLTLITGPLDSIMDRKDVSPQTQKDLELMHRNVKLLRRYVDQVLDFQKLDSHIINLILSNDDIISFTKDVTGSFTYQLENKKCRFSFSSDVNELITWFDMEKLEKILYNLMSNAIKSTPNDGTISVHVSADVWNVFIAIKDSGVGIPADQLDLIFERYHQVEKAKTFRKGGSGIGLAHTKELVALHKGKIKVTSTEMKGSEFTIAIPRDESLYKAEDVVFLPATYETDHEAYYPNTIRAMGEAENNIQTKTFDIKEQKEIGLTKILSVLVVEDDLDMHNYISDSLHEYYHIYHAYNGDEGYKLAVENNPSIIISDIMMDGMDGMELCHKIKTDIQVCHIPVILLTALTSVENKIVGYETGADEYMTKPFDTKLLQARIQNMILSRNTLREIFSKALDIEPQKVTITKLDEEFLSKAIKIVGEHISDRDFSVDIFCARMNMSRSVFFRKIKSLTNLSVTDFIRDIKLKQSARMLKEREFSISQIAFELGFTDQKHFSRTFRKYFGQSPSNFINSEKVN